MLLNPRGFVKCLQDFKLPTLSLLTSILSKLLQMSILLSFFLPSIKTNHYFPTKEGCGNKYSQDLNQKLCLERKPQMI